MRISLLGPVRAWGRDVELELGPGQRKAVLTVLAMRANQLVTRGELIDAVWGESAPASVYGGIHTHISALRKRLEPQRPQRAECQVLVSAGAGYRLMAALERQGDRVSQLGDMSEEIAANMDRFSRAASA